MMPSPRIAANIQSPTRVVPKHRKPAGYLIRVSARAGGSDDRDSSPRAGILSIRVILPANQSTPVTSFERVISGVTSLARVAWGRTVERSRTIFALRAPALSPRQGTFSGFADFCRPLVAAGKPSFLPLVQACKQASGGVTQTFRFPPVRALLSPAVHGQTMQHKDTRDHGNSYRQHG